MAPVAGAPPVSHLHDRGGRDEGTVGRTPAALDRGPHPELSIWECAERLAQAGVRELPVVREGRVIGIVGEGDILRALQERGGPD